MTFKLKALVAAVAFAAAGHAMAAIQPGNIGIGATGSELVFYAIDDVAKTSYVKDLGVTFASFLAAPTFSSVSIASDTNWTQYLNNSSISNTKWGIFATEKTSASTTVADGVNILTTARNNAPVGTGSSLVRGIDGSFNNTYLGAVQSSSNTDYATDLSYFASGATNAANWAAGLQHNLAGKVSFSADNTIGALANFYRLSTKSGTGNATQTTILSAPTQWKFDSAYTLQVTAVPEPETYSMLAAGLLMLGAVARRRKF